MHRDDRHDPQTTRERYDDRDERWRGRDDDRFARERDDQYRWATDRDDFGGAPGRHELERGAEHRHDRGERYDHDPRWGRGHDEMDSGGWGRDDYGFRGPSFHDRGDMRGPELRERRDRWQASGGYSEPRGAQGMHREGRYGSGPLPDEGTMRASQRGKGPKNFTRSDERIREEVCERLEDSHAVDATNIEVRVANGEVTLEGTVNDRRAKRDAEDVVYEARGVKQVHNLLRVGVGEQWSGSTRDGNGTRASSSNGGARSTEAGRS